MKYKIITPSEAINNLDLQPIIDQMTDEPDSYTGLHGWPVEFAEKMAEQYRALWYISLKYPDELIIPFRELDEFWHVHILNTEKYMQDCEAVFGRYLHHFPYPQKTPEIEAFYIDHYARTLELLKKEFPNID